MKISGGAAKKFRQCFVLEISHISLIRSESFRFLPDSIESKQECCEIFVDNLTFSMKVFETKHTASINSIACKDNTHLLSGSSGNRKKTFLISRLPTDSLGLVQWDTNFLL